MDEPKRDPLIVGLCSPRYQEANAAARECLARGTDVFDLLLSLQGNKQPFYGSLGNPKAASLVVVPVPGFELTEAQKEKAITVEVAALYLISAIHHERLDFAQSPLLSDTSLPPKERVAANKPAYVDRAFQSSRDWVQRCKKVGLPKLREQKDDPLRASGLRWW
jgi:hypothetical protein